MSRVSIKRMSLHYFKGIREMEVSFGQADTYITGPNASGKSTIVDGFVWCLWGKNAKGESDTKFLVKTVDQDGVEIPDVNHEVEVTLEADGCELVLRRVLVPEYDKDGELKGNHTDYFFNEVPCKKSEYDRKVSEIVDEQVFRLITSPFAFLSMDWRQQRDLLVRIAGDVSDADIAKTRPEFAVVLAELMGSTMDEYKRKISAQLQKVRESMLHIPARIDEVRRGTPAEEDFAKLEEDKLKVQAELSRIEDAMRDEFEAEKQKNQEALSLRKQIQDLRLRQSDILAKAQAEERNAIHEGNARYDEAERLKRFVEAEEANDFKNVSLMQKNKQAMRKKLVSDIMALQKDLTGMRNEWLKVNQEEFSAEEFLTCPLYKHKCTCHEACDRYDGEQQEAFGKWREGKAERLEAINAKGKSLKESLGEMKVQDEKLDAELQEIGSDYGKRSAERRKKIEDLDKVMEQNPHKPLVSTVKGEDIEEWMGLERTISVLEGRIEESSDAIRMDAGLKEQKAQLENSISAINQKLAVRIQIDAAAKRVEELEASLKSLGSQKAELEYQLMTANDFEIAKVSAVTEKVNGLFHLVKWKMFARQVNGDLVPTCQALVNGVRWSDANSAARLNAGIDVASCLARNYGVSVPMFIDNAESCGSVYDPGTCQRIILEHDRRAKELTVTI